MSSFDMEPVDEAKFAAFLQGKDEVSKILRSMPQPKPRSELDAAILAMVAADLPNPAKIELGQEISQPIHAVAANQSHFLQRWRAPLGMAASAALIFPMLLLWENGWQYSEKSEMPSMAETGQAAPEAPTASAASPASAAVNESIEPIVGFAPPPVAAKRAVTRDSGNEEANLAKNSENTGPVVMDLHESKAESALEKSRAAQTVAVQKAEQQARQVADARQQAEANARQKFEAEKIVRADIADSEREQALSKAKKAQGDRAETRSSARPQAPVPAVVAVTPAQILSEELSAPSPMAAPQSVDAAASAAKKSTVQPKVWLSLVEELLKANMQQEALEEWQKFRKAYPYHPVDPRLEEKINALQKK